MYFSLSKKSWIILKGKPTVQGHRNIINVQFNFVQQRKYAENLLTSLEEDYSLYPLIDGVKGRHRMMWFTQRCSLQSRECGFYRCWQRAGQRSSKTVWKLNDVSRMLKAIIVLHGRKFELAMNTSLLEHTH